jgi:hypothetical protein
LFSYGYAVDNTVYYQAAAVIQFFNF